MKKNEQDTVMGSNTGVALSQLLIFNTVKRHRDLQWSEQRVSIICLSGTVSPLRNQEDNFSG